MLSPIRYEGATLHLIDQRSLPREEAWVACQSLESVAEAIETMVVRGAPAIGCAAGFGLVLDATNSNAPDWQAYKSQFARNCSRLEKTRPTAVNLFHTIERMRQVGREIQDSLPMEEAHQLLQTEAARVFERDLETCHLIGRYGAQEISGRANALTHCNAGALATAGYGTALGVVRALHEDQRLSMTYVDETRPFLQGSRLTAFELMHDGIPCQLITDSMAAYLMQQGKVDVVVVGADRIAANGDTANKIGTYSLAVAARYHSVPFYVAAPQATIDLSTPSGAEIPIEERAPEEVTHVGSAAIAPPGVSVYNPSFDVTPQPLITGIITEHGVCKPPFTKALQALP